MLKHKYVLVFLGQTLLYFAIFMALIYLYIAYEVPKVWEIQFTDGDKKRNSWNAARGYKVG